MNTGANSWIDGDIPSTKCGHCVSISLTRRQATVVFAHFYRWTPFNFEPRKGRFDVTRISGRPDSKREDDPLDTFCYGIAIPLGDAKGF